MRPAACRTRPVVTLILLALVRAAFATPLPAADGCLTVTAADGARLGTYPIPATDRHVVLRYLHSVTLTPVEERYEVAGATWTQTALSFEEHGPGLPTEADAGGRWSHEEGRFVVRLDRSFDGITARVDPAQSPTLLVGGRTVNLAAWGRRSVRLAARDGRCLAR